MFSKQQGRDLYGFWHYWWLYKLIQVISRANLFVEKQEPTHRRAAFEFWTLNKVLISSRALIFFFSQPSSKHLPLFIFFFFSFASVSLYILRSLIAQTWLGFGPDSWHVMPAFAGLDLTTAGHGCFSEQWGESSLFSNQKVMYPNTGAAHKGPVWV